MPTRIGIVGFGRVGRSLYRQGYDKPGIEFVAIGDSAEPQSLAYLLNNSSIEGRFKDEAVLSGNYLYCAGQKTRVIPESGPGHIPWDALGVDVVIECTSKHRALPEMEKHLEAGAKLVVMSTPALDETIPTFVIGVNELAVTGRERIVSCGSSSVHALALMIRVFEEAVGIEYASMTTVHAYTGDQTLSDTARPGLRWSRSAAQNIIPNVTWAPSIIEKIIPSLAGRIQGLALNVPVAAGSNIDLVAKLAEPLNKDDVNALFRKASEGELKGLLGYTEEPIVSSDVISDPRSVVMDATATLSIGGGMVKALGWFDNGWAYASRLLETAELITGKSGGGR